MIYFWSVKIIYLVKIFWKINNLENYLESGDVCISIDSSITDYQYFPLNGYLMWFVWIWMPHLFLNKRSLFGLTGKGPWGRITHSEYVIRRYELHLKIGVEDRIFARAIGWPIDCLCTELQRYRDSLSDGKSDQDCEYPDCKDFFVSAFGFVRSRNRLVWIVCLTLQVEI